MIIFGRSLFLNDVDIPNLIKNYTTMGFNQFGRNYNPSYLVFYDSYYMGFDPRSLVLMPKWFPQKHGIKYAPKPSAKPFLQESKDVDGFLQLGHKYYSPSIGINYAILKGQRDIYLVGIDHVESDKSFVHFDGEESKPTLTPDSHIRFKEYIYNCAKHVNIYQCNPAVKDQWALPYKDIEELYVKTG